MILKKSVFLSFFFLLSHFLFSQNVRHLSVGDGLPQSFVSGIVEDKEGFIWISTHNGLARYDGNNFKIFQNKPSDSTSISSNFISHTVKGANDDLWLRFDSGAIDMFDMKTHKVEHVVTNEFLDKNKLVVARRGWLVSYSGFFWYIAQSGKVFSFRLPNLNSKHEHAVVNKYDFGNEAILSVMEDTKHNIWVLSENSISKLDANKNEFINYTIPYTTDFDFKFDFGEEIPVIVERDTGELMWMDKKHLYFFTPLKKGFKRIKLPEEAVFNGKLLTKGPEGKEYFQVNNTIYSYNDTSVFTKEAGLTLSNNRDTQALLVDDSGLIWLGANTDGLYQIDLNTNFKSFRYNKDFAVDLLKKELGVSVYDFFNISSIDRGLLSPAYYLRSAHDRQRDITWVAINRTVGYFNTFDKKLKKLPALPGTRSQSENFNPIKGITLLQNKSLVVIDQSNNIFIYKEELSSWQKLFSQEEIKKSIGFTVNPSGLLADENNLWITTEYNGVLYIDLNKKKVSQLSKNTVKNKIPARKLYGIVPDKTNQHILWIASNLGLLCLDKNTLKSTLFSVEEGLPDNMIYSILMDEVGYLWLGTNKGLCRFDTKTYQTRTFTERHGLPCFEFNRYHQFYFPDGRIAFGGVDSGVIFNPLLIKDDLFNPNTAVTGIKINNTPFKEEIPSNTITHIELPYNQNTLSIQYAALEFSQPQDIVYRYRLTGYDNNWVVSGNKREATYTKVPPGSYLFEVNATNITGKWSTKVKTVTIKILPPWWATWWAFSSYILVAVLITIMFINYSIKQGLIKNEILLKQKEAEQLREMDEVKSRFFSNITHELRTPLTLIMGPAEQLKKVNEKEQQNHLLSIITKNANSLLNLTNQLLDIAKLEAGALKPYILLGDIVSEIKQVIEVFSEEAATKNNTIKFEGPEKAEYFFAPDILERIMYNLLSNALKYSNPGDEVTIKLTEEHTGITLEIKDTGRGIPKNELENIFKRFYHIDYDKKEVGAGIGLSLVKELIELQEGAIDVNSTYGEENHGTAFTIFLPYKKPDKQAVVTAATKAETAEDTTNVNLSIKSNNKPTVLLVEDNKELASFIETSLKPYYNIFYAENGKAGIDMALEIIPDLILSDVLMDEMDGFEMCRFLKEDINTDHIPIILLTAKSDTGSKLEGLSYKADDYITKPFNVSELLLRIENRLELQKKQRNYIYRKFKLLPEETKADGKMQDAVVEDSFLQKVYEVIENRLDDETLSVEELAATLNMSRTSLHRKIKTLTNMTTGEIIKVYRLKKAVLLLQENYNISEVAYKTGFGSPSYFAKCFKEVYSLTPTQYTQKNTL
ncbi:response regulator [Flavobacterium salilacus subsp. salilacus]|uniref:ATP-binding protein n=1 Tax=Flavobacterium TaxID=237 RepID=UPI001074FE5D|nr:MULTISPECIES: ATP-binding protein [Flavobacterium]KAF2515438.1 response regulator [Flavobacterium salilacus subsp. salilacus]MBE1615833.1 response regulator [Flavobacterium sp. SaA2.13]